MRFRRLLGPTLGVWLVCQNAPLLLTSVAPPTTSALTAERACTCPHGAPGECPMHKKAAGQTPCLVRGVDDSAAAIIGSLFGPAGLVAAPASLMAPVLVGTCSLVVLSSVTDRALPPDPPPPRA
jgi:hypothetical protein